MIVNGDRGWLVILLMLGVGCSDGPGSKSSEQNQIDGVSVVVIPDEVACTECSIELEQVAVLGSLSDPASFEAWAVISPCTVGRLGSGVFLSGAPVGGGEIFTYDSAGRYAGSIGRPGSGPGEFGYGLLALITSDTDTLTVIDRSNARVQTFDGSGEFVRSFALPKALSGFAQLESGNLVLHPEVVGSDPPFLLTSPEGELIRSIGTPGREGGRWWAAASGLGGFWEVDAPSYEITHRTEDGSASRHLEREANWFTDPQVEGVEPPFIWGLWEDEDERIWTVTAVADPEGSGTGTMSPSYDQVIEVLDPRAGVVLARETYVDWYSPMCGPDLMYRTIESTEGDTQVEIVRPLLRRPG